MMGPNCVLWLMLAMIVGPVAVPTSAAAQCRLCDIPTTGAEPANAPDSPVRLEVEASLDFDRLVLTGTDGGTASLTANGSRSVSGSVTELSSRAMVGSAIIRGEPGKTVRINLPSRIEMIGLNGSRITIEDIESDLPSGARLTSSGTLSFHFGGRLRILGNAEGDYRGDIPITVEYP